MENYTSDSSDSEQNKVIDFSYFMLDSPMLEENINKIINSNKTTLSEIESLILSHNQINILPNNVLQFNYLQILDISSNGLTVLPDVLLKCPLTSLIAKNNNLRNESLPKTFTFQSSLKELNLSGNLLESFPEQILELTSLKYLYLGGNYINNIPTEIWKLRCLQVLSLGGNHISEVPASVGELTLLHALVLSDNEVVNLPANIANLHHLKSLLLHKNKLRTLPPEIIALKNLTELSLRDNPLVVRFVTDMTLNPASLLELSARVIKVTDLKVCAGDLPQILITYLDSGHRCVNTKCKGVYFDNHIEHIKFVDFCGKYRLPLLQYLCSSKCIDSRECIPNRPANRYMMQKVLLG